MSSTFLLNGVAVELGTDSPLDVARLAEALHGGAVSALPTSDTVGSGSNDLPGDDDSSTPRPIGSRRLVTVKNEAASVVVRVYESEVALPQARAHFANEMLARGWHGGDDAVQTSEALGFWDDRADVVVAFAEDSREGARITRTTVAFLAR